MSSYRASSLARPALRVERLVDVRLRPVCSLPGVLTRVGVDRPLSGLPSAFLALLHEDLLVPIVGTANAYVLRPMPCPVASVRNQRRPIRHRHRRQLLRDPTRPRPPARLLSWPHAPDAPRRSHTDSEAQGSSFRLVGRGRSGPRRVSTTRLLRARVLERCRPLEPSGEDVSASRAGYVLYRHARHVLALVGPPRPR